MNIREHVAKDIKGEIFAFLRLRSSCTLRQFEDAHPHRRPNSIKREMLDLVSTGKVFRMRVGNPGGGYSMHYELVSTRGTT